MPDSRSTPIACVDLPETEDVVVSTGLPKLIEMLVAGRTAPCEMSRDKVVRTRRLRLPREAARRANGRKQEGGRLLQGRLILAVE